MRVERKLVRFWIYLKGEPSFLDVFDVGCKRRRGIKDDFRDLEMSICKDGVISTEMGNTMKLAALGSILGARIGAC